jgi:hypothetical protein
MLEKSVSFSSALILMGLSAAQAGPIIPFSFTGQYTGQVNSVPIAASATGQLEVTGNSLNSIQIAFQSIPSSLDPLALGNSWATSYCALAVLPSGGALNLFDLSGGNFTAGRTSKWPSLPGEQIVVGTQMSTTGSAMTYTSTVNGTYTGPTDLVAVNGYTMLWTQLSPTSIQVTATASLLRANGQSFEVDLSTVYNGLSVQMPFSEQGTLTFTNESFVNNVLSFDWQGTLGPVPEPSSFWLVIILLPLIGWRAFRRRGNAS